MSMLTSMVMVELMVRSMLILELTVT